MLLRFSVTNHASIRDPLTFSTVAMDPHPDLAVRRIPRSKHHALPVIGIFGPNASGKSNIVDAMTFMRHCIRTSHQQWLPGDKIPRRPFVMDEESREMPTQMAVEFILSEVRYVFEFACTDYKFLSESLYSYPEGKPRLIYERDGSDQVRFGSYFSGQRKLLTSLMRSNSLFLSVAAANNHPALTEVYEWFGHSYRVATDANASDRVEETLRELTRDKDSILNLIRYADFGISEFLVKRREYTPEAHEHLMSFLRAADPAIKTISPGDVNFTPEIRVIHEVGNRRVPLEFRHESSGTQTWLSIVGPISSTLKTGTTLVIDELDARLHPTLAGYMVKLFQEPATNPKGAQLIFNSHDVTLLGPQAPCRLRRDQVYLTEKDHESQSTTLFPLTEYRVREGLDNVERSYLRGRYGGLPFVDESLLVDLSSGRG
ncbi:ATP-binding protein [Actinocatenispora sera]|uniref:AAA family ATPase n=1 Tax=Actinocatenispora sera TaxID=390989 RepID=UPI0033C637D3